MFVKLTLQYSRKNQQEMAKNGKNPAPELVQGPFKEVTFAV
jgi:hypothetical protein